MWKFKDKNIQGDSCFPSSLLFITIKLIETRISPQEWIRTTEENLVGFASVGLTTITLDHLLRNYDTIVSQTDIPYRIQPTHKWADQQESPSVCGTVPNA